MHSTYVTTVTNNVCCTASFLTGIDIDRFDTKLAIHQIFPFHVCMISSSGYS